MSTAAIIGLGLLGGSLARDLASRGWRVIGYDRNPDVLEKAQQSGVLSHALGPDLHGLDAADVAVLAVPVQDAPGLLRLARPFLDAMPFISDVGSTKRAICAQAQTLGLGARFVGAHPFVGDHRSGWEVSRAGLFRNARVFLCPLPETQDATLERARSLWQLVDARTETISAEEHDAQLAWASHLPQLASTAVALALQEAGIAVDQLGRGGRDVTRLAASDPAMWTGIVLENAALTGPALTRLERGLRELRRQIEAADEAGIRSTFARAVQWTQSSREA